MYNPCRVAVVIVRELAYELPDTLLLRPGIIFVFPVKSAAGAGRQASGPTGPWLSQQMG